MNQSPHLFQLQKIDTQCDQIILRIREIEVLVKDNEKLQLAENTLQQAKLKTQAAKKALQKIEDEVRLVVVKKEQSEASLYGGKIRNPKELQDLQTEISSLSRRISALEEDQLGIMLLIDDHEKHEKEMAADLSMIQSEAATKNARLLGEKGNLEQSLSRLKLERQAVLSSIDPGNIEIYNNLRKNKRGLAVAAIQDTACTACGAFMRPAEIQVARSPQEMAFCSSCGRILFAG